jgi:hypothetical protein
MEGKREPVFVKVLRSPGFDSQPGGPVHDNTISHTAPPSYIGWRNRLLGIDASLNIYKFGLR